MRQRGVFVSAVFLVTALAGCAASDADTSGAAEDAPFLTIDPAGDSGAVEGTVIDDSVNPVAGALVALTTTTGQIQGMSDASGHFVLNGVPPGTYSLYVAALGYDSIGKSI